MQGMAGLPGWKLRDLVAPAGRAMRPPARIQVRRWRFVISDEVHAQQQIGETYRGRNSARHRSVSRRARWRWRRWHGRTARFPAPTRSPCAAQLNVQKSLSSFSLILREQACGHSLHIFACERSGGKQVGKGIPGKHARIAAALPGRGSSNTLPRRRTSSRSISRTSSLTPATCALRNKEQ